jgi:hypothetical protein
MTSNPSWAALPAPSMDWARAASTPPPTRGAKAAREFESFLVGSLLDSLEKTFATVPETPMFPARMSTAISVAKLCLQL